MLWVLLVDVGLPLVFGLAFMFLRASSSPRLPSWDLAVDTSLDLVVLGIGATGAVFEDAAVAKTFSGHQAAVGIGIIGVSFLSSAPMFIVRRYVFRDSARKFLLSFLLLLLGSFGLLTVSAVLSYAYRASDFGFSRQIYILGFALGGSALVSLVVCLIVRVMVDSVSSADRLAERLRESGQYGKALDDFAANHTISIDQLENRINRKSGVAQDE